MPEPERKLEVSRIATGEDPGAWVESLRGFDPARATILKREGDSGVYRAALRGRDVVIKTRALRGVDRVKLMLGHSRGARHWRGAEWLAGRGIATARPYVLAIERASGVAREWLVLECLSGRTVLRHIADCDLSVREEHALARAIAHQVFALSSAGRFNRDHKPSNIIAAPDGPAIIDCVAIRPGKGGAQRMLHALAVEPLGLGLLPRRALMARVVHGLVAAEHARGAGFPPAAQWLARRAARRAYWSLVAESLRRHGDAKPRTDPLATPVR